jgi:hypothetical protein
MNRVCLLTGFLFVAFGLVFGGVADVGVFVECEAFDSLGGWVVDSQFMDEMGSPFLLAHGLGRPVGDAVTTVEFAETGAYRVWVRTRDWVGPWKRKDTPESKRAYGCPGKFKLLIDGKDFGVTFGTKGDDWFWHHGGMVEITKKEVKVALHDLTGFEGRCDAVLFCKDTFRQLVERYKGLKLVRLHYYWHDYGTFKSKVLSMVYNIYPENKTNMIFIIKKSNRIQKDQTTI